MSDETPEPAEIDETRVEPPGTTNDLSEQDDVWVADDQTPYPEDDEPVDLATVDGTLTIDSDGNLTADNALALPTDGAQ